MNLAKDAPIFIAGHNGLVGNAVTQALKNKGYTNLITRNRSELDLTNQAETNAFFLEAKPVAVILCAAKVGGILANKTYPADFIYQNMMIAANVIHAAYKHNVRKLVNLGSSCIYPRLAKQPITEDSLLTGPLESTNEAYAIAKISAIKLCRYYNEQYGTNFISLMPTNLYGPHDNFDLKASHVLPALIRKFSDAKEANTDSVTLWGSGQPMREFLYIEDMADAVVFTLENIESADCKEVINLGTGIDVTIKDAAELVRTKVGFGGSIKWDATKPDGTPRKLLDVSQLASLGWQATHTFDEGITKTIDWFNEHKDSIKGR